MSQATLASNQPTQGSSTLSRELADFLVEFQIALHKHAIYPPEHPLVRAAVESVEARLWALFAAERTSLSIGVARRQLIIEGVATDPAHPLLGDLAQRLHRHHVGAIKLVKGAGVAEIDDLLSTLATEASRTGADALGLRATELNGRWSHVRLFPLTYGQLQLIEDEPEPDEADGGTGMRAGHGAQLWVGLARAALAAEPTEADPEAQALEPVVIAKAIEDHDREVAYDQVVVGYMLQIAEELRQSRGKETLALQKRISRLVGSLDPRTLQTLVQMGGDDQQRRRFLLDASQGMTVDAVIELVKAAAVAEQQTISHSMLRLLSKLSQHADRRTGTRNRAADLALRENVARLVSDWGLEDPNPGAYRQVLDQLSRESRAVLAQAETPLACEPERVLQMALELDAVGPASKRALAALTARGADGVNAVLDLLDGAPVADSAERVWNDFVATGPLGVLLESPRANPAAIVRLAARQGAAAAPTLVAAIEESDGRHNAAIGDAIAALGDAAAPVVARRAAIVPAEVQRELLPMLLRVPTTPPEFNVDVYIRSADPVVRRDALRIALRAVGEPTMVAWKRALRTGLEDADPAVAAVALEAAAQSCPREVIPALLLRVQRGELDARFRARAIHVVGAQRDAAYVPWLVARVVAPRKWYRRTRLRPKSPEAVAAVAALATYHREAPAAAVVFELVAASGDPELRRAASGVIGTPEGVAVPLSAAS